MKAQSKTGVGIKERRFGHSWGNREASKTTPALNLSSAKEKVARVGTVHPAEEKAAGRPYSSLSVPEGGL